ncbi:MAG TPA: P-loop NTPase fold protein [Candidatus Angelobacter sp.]|nr:P-loop NTPase fold protein [Candidatus Angelobacter sp.]
MEEKPHGFGSKLPDYESEPESSASSEDRPSRESVGPNSVSDQPTAQDSLGFTPYVHAVAAFLLHEDTRPPLTISIEGEWGSGKSSFMLQLQDRISKAGAKTVWFNAWRHDKDDELWASFALDFTNKLTAQCSWYKRWFLRLWLSMRRFDWRQGWFQLIKSCLLLALFSFVTWKIIEFIRGDSTLIRAMFDEAAKGKAGAFKMEEWVSRLLIAGGGSAAYLVMGIALIRKIVDLLGNPLETHLKNYVRDPGYETRVSFIEAFHSDFERLVRIYSEKKRVFVFIDDLDRCEIPKAAELMQALNMLISESAPVFYVLGLDREKVAAGLAAKYEKLIPYLSAYASEKDVAAGTKGREFGYAFLEKFIQIPFLVPRPTETDVEKLLAALRNTPTGVDDKPITPESPINPGLLVELSADSESVGNLLTMVAGSFEFNPRRLKQFLNLFRLRALLASQTGLFGPPRDSFSILSFEQLGKLVAIMLRWPLLLADLEADPQLLEALQLRAWSETVTIQGINRKRRAPTGAENYWASRLDLIKLIAYPFREGRPLTELDEETYGLLSLDVERILQVSPPVRGRETRSNEPTEPRQRGTSKEELQQKSAQNWREADGSASGSGRRNPEEPPYPATKA